MKNAALNRTLYSRMAAASRKWRILTDAYAHMREKGDMCEDCLAHLNEHITMQMAVAEELLDILDLKCPHCERRLSASDFWEGRPQCFRCKHELTLSMFDEQEVQN